MKFRPFFLCLCLLAVLMGCASNRSTVKETNALKSGERVVLKIDIAKAASEEGAAVFRNRLEQQLSSAGIALDDSSSGRTLEVILATYAVRHPAKRALFGAFAGRDKLQSRVLLRDGNGELASEFFVTSQDASAIGSIRLLIEQHADKIVESLVGTLPPAKDEPAVMGRP